MFKCVFIEPVAVRAGAVCCNSHKSTADKSASAARGGAYRLWHDTVHEQPLEIPDMLQINTVFGMNVSRLPAELKHFIRWIHQNTISSFVLSRDFSVFVLQVEVKSKKEVSLLDLDDCEFFFTVKHWLSNIKKPRHSF